MTTNGTRDAVRQAAQFFRKADPPALGPSFEGARPEWYLGPMSGHAQSPVLMFDLSRLTWLDYAEMRWHPQVNASLSLITFMLHQIDWHIESEDKKAAEVVEENLRLIWTQLVRGLSTAYWAGYAPLVLEWENTNDNRIFISKVKDLHPGEASVNWKEVDVQLPAAARVRQEDHPQGARSMTASRSSDWTTRSRRSTRCGTRCSANRTTTPVASC